MKEPKVTYATVREGDEELHIECRFDDGQKFAAVKVEDGFDGLAHGICDWLNRYVHPRPVTTDLLNEFLLELRAARDLLPLGGDLRSAFNDACDRLDVLDSKLRQIPASDGQERAGE